MARVLVVEDSPEQARMIAGLLEAADLQVELAPDGAAAVRALAERAPDLVLTDLIMPGRDGLQVVEAVRREHPEIPVVLMTAFGSEEIARRALQKGAASYVPKARLREELVATTRGLLAVARAARDEQRILEHLVASESRFVLGNDPALIAPLVSFVHGALHRAWGEADETELMHVGVAVQEAVLNAMHHGNLEVASDLREAGGDDYRALVESRRHLPQYRGRRVEVRVVVETAEVRIVVRDEGPGFDPSTVADPTNPGNLERVSGRGLYLIWTFMDQVSHNRTGNEITMVKRRAAR
jgi:CheY-like chemotaxis protein/anti-sigma regulatory factor (Ser/Thr protein kinase)